MNMQNKSNIYTIYNAPPPSYAEATGAPASETHDLQFEQGFPHAVASSSPSASFPYPYPPNCYPDRTPVQSAYSPVQSVYPEYEPAEWQSQPTDVTFGRTFIRGTREDKSCRGAVRAIWILGIFASAGCIIALILKVLH